MIHLVVDAYGCNTSRADNLRDIYEIINTVINTMNVKAIMPPQLVPYYYSKDPTDVGISAFVLTEGGHFTIHTFPQWKCYFADLLFDGYVNKEELEAILKRELPARNMFIKRIDRREFESGDMSMYKDADFGPHYMISTRLNHEPTIDEFMAKLDHLPQRINMHPITRPYVLKSSIDNPKYLSGIVVIAESHIALHYNYATREVLMDIFSCKTIDNEKYKEVMKDFFDAPIQDVLIARGRKNEQLIDRQENKYNGHKSWQDNILGTKD